MSSDAKSELIAFLVANYADLTRQVADRFGSTAAAHDLLHEAYVRLHRNDAQISDVINPRGYIIRMIFNIVRNRARDEGRMQFFDNQDDLWQVADEAPDQHRIVAGRAELEMLHRELEALPPRRAAIFRRIWGQGASYTEVAAEFGIAERTARNEMLVAVRTLHGALKNNFTQKLRTRLRKVSSG